MNYSASTRILLLASTLVIGCADDGKSDDELGSDTDDSTGTGFETDGTGSETSSTDSGTSSTDSETSSTDTADTSESTDATESTDSTESSETDATESTESTDSTDTADTNDTGEEVMCPNVFPDFDKSCSVDSDCAVVIHTTDCCGNSVAWGLAVGEVGAFDAAEAICDSQYPDCDCPTGPTVAEDGNEAWEPAEFAAHCLMGSCMSFVL